MLKTPGVGFVNEIKIFNKVLIRIIDTLELQLWKKVFYIIQRETGLLKKTGLHRFRVEIEDFLPRLCRQITTAG